ncbi:energy transducer TonB [Teredinibacter sp. KSP-S5-2]|uniref:energy transducer TonB n=1 Tax=Teredinibacter sp. KSP-S5-2 TaxID=3034506 RepID=UPI002935007A|nr:energy transducer TonB [Teredinibacter sp. KSP-S5-2]WNO09354.1 energy transducer TonB [Teredinibacter sp. KSP-S5-2]
MNIEDAVSSNDRLSFTLFIAAAIHALLVFGISFKIDKGNTIAPTLNITLATHKSQVEPEKADFLAQMNQEASGTAEEVKELSTKKVAEIEDISIRDTFQAAHLKESTPQTARNQLLATIQDQSFEVSTDELSEEEKEEETDPGHQEEVPWVNPEIASLRAKLDKIKQDMAKQPRIRRLTSVSTKKSYDAEYLYKWSQKIEAIGNQNFPEEALQKQIFGNLRLSVTIYPNGAVKSVEVLQSSGHSILDRAAEHIVRLASPFAPFPKEIRSTTDQLEIIRTWRFEISGLSTGK